jgi:hypothetical protein
MSIRLISHVNRDDDLIEAWLQHYLHLGVASFHLIVHGGVDQNRTLHALRSRYPITILDEYEGTFDVFEKRERLTWGLARLRGGWVVLVDSDEFLELPYRTLAGTIRMMQWLRADALSAPMLQRFSHGGVVDIDGARDPFETYPWCSTDLYAQLGQPQAVIDKYPVFALTRQTALRSGGNHYPPNGYGSRVAPMLGVSHHFKWRVTVRERLAQRANSTHPYRGESIQYLSYLEEANWQLPVTGAFRYSRAELFRRGLLTRPAIADLAVRRADVVEVRGGRDRVFAYMVSPDSVAARVARDGHHTVALCGAGSGGRMFLNAFARHGVTATCVIDRDPAQWGTRVQGVPVVSLDAALDAGARVFVTGSLTYGAEMAAGVERRAGERGLTVTVYSTAQTEAAA